MDEPPANPAPADDDRSSAARAVTAYDVAERAGVSQSAVSRAFTSGASISPAKRAKVIAAAEALGYRPNLLARSLTTRRSELVGLAAGNLENPFFTTLLDALSAELTGAKLHLMMFTARMNAQVDAQIEDVLRYRVNALVLLSTVMSDTLARECIAAGLPTITINRAAHDLGGCGVSGENAAGAAAIAAHLIAQGYQRIAIMPGIVHTVASTEREVAFTDCLAAHGLPPPLREPGRFTRAGATAAMRALLALPERPDAIFCANDHMACAAIDVLREMNLQPGRDIGIAGFDDVPMASWPSYDLTTYSVPVGAIAREVVRLIRDYASLPPDRRIVVPGHLVVRSSTRR